MVDPTKPFLVTKGAFLVILIVEVVVSFRLADDRTTRMSRPAHAATDIGAVIANTSLNEVGRTWICLVAASVVTAVTFCITGADTRGLVPVILFMLCFVFFHLISVVVDIEEWLDHHEYTGGVAGAAREFWAHCHRKGIAFNRAAAMGLTVAGLALSVVLMAIT